MLKYSKWQFKNALVFIYTSIFLLLFSTLANGLILGDARIISKLNEPLNIELELLANDPKEWHRVSLNLASHQQFEQAGLDRPYCLSTIQFKFETHEGKSVVRLTTQEPIKEPVLNLLLELGLPSGRILKEYTVLLDPPELATTTTATVAVKAEQNNNKKTDLNQALQARIGQIEQATTSLKEENNHLHDLLQIKEKEIELLQEKQQHAQNLSIEKKQPSPNLMKAQLFDPVMAPANVEEMPISATVPSSTSVWFALILTLLMATIVALRAILKQKEITLPSFSFKKKIDTNIGQPFSAFRSIHEPLSQESHQEFQHALSILQAAEEKKMQNNLSKKQIDEKTVAVVLPNLEDAEIYITFSKFKMAEEIILKILHHQPDNVKARLKLIDLLLVQERTSEIEAQFTLLPPDYIKENVEIYHAWQERFKILQGGSSDTEKPDDSHLLAPSVELSGLKNPVDLESTVQANHIATQPELDPALFQTKLDFAKVYLDMKDIDSAKDLLNEIIQSGSDDLKAKAQALLDKVSGS